MTETLFPVALYDSGYLDLVSIIPPGATLTPGSKIQASSLGKVPGRQLANGTWGGYSWRTFDASRADVERWALHGANIGLRADRTPGLDIDSTDPALAATVHDWATAILGPAPCRVGRDPKRLLVYRLADDAPPISRMRLWAERDGQSHLIELLGKGQQYLVYGTHPVTLRPYAWPDGPPGPYAQLSAITPDRAAGLFWDLQRMLEEIGYAVHREGDGQPRERGTAIQDDLVAPSTDLLAAAVSVIPNDDAHFPGREEYIRVGYAIRAAAGDKLEEGFEIFAEWAGRHAADARVAGNPETWRADWRRMHAPYAVGWGWIRDTARGFGWTDAPEVFDVLVDVPPPPVALPAAAPLRVRLSDRWLAERVVQTAGDRVRFVPALSQWLTWDGHRWRRDSLLYAQRVAADVLHGVVREEIAAAGPGGVTTTFTNQMKDLESTNRLLNVLKQVRADRTIAVEPGSLDTDPWVLNTPAGVVDLRTGAVAPGTPELLLTRSTGVGPAPGAMAVWTRYLGEATGGDAGLVAYMQRLGGYCLTGNTSEQMLAFVWGPGRSGKGTFLTTLREILGDYATVANMDLFHARTGGFEKHSTDLADLAGARLVLSSETQDGQRWDEQRIKAMTGGDAIKARFMRQDNFVFVPAFKLFFIGNYQPTIRGADSAMMRRMHMIPFPHRVPEDKKDLHLQERLRAEYPAILAWMIEGCLQWQQGGLRPPACVVDSTATYFEEEDAVGRWLAERCERGAGVTRSKRLYQDWKEWAQENGEFVGSHKRLSQMLKTRGVEATFESGTRLASFRGVTLRPSEWEASL